MNRRAAIKATQFIGLFFGAMVLAVGLIWFVSTYTEIARWIGVALLVAFLWLMAYLTVEQQDQDTAGFLIREELIGDCEKSHISKEELDKLLWTCKQETIEAIRDARARGSL